MPPVHNSPFRGTWYPDPPSELEELLDRRFTDSCRRTGPFLFSDALAFVTPHAGPAYSGTVAAAVYRTLQQQQPEQIILLGFPHHGGLWGVAAPDVAAIDTPFGEVAIHPFEGFPQLTETQLCDHSVEIQLPFLQRAVPRARITPLYVGDMDADERRQSAAILAAAWRPGTVFLASSDFTHYGRDFGYQPFPLDRSTPARLEILDFECIDAAGSLDSEFFRETLRHNGATVCGSAPIALLLDVLHLLEGDGIWQSVLDYQTSGQITGDYRHSVSYAALAYCRPEAFELSASDREALLDSAAVSLRHLRETGERTVFPAKSGSAALQARRGVFVSLHQDAELLGCLGHCATRDPLAVAVPELALSAALEDPRFRPAADVAGPVDIEVSVLTPFRRIRNASPFRVGRHGAMLKLGAHSGLLLPQVGSEHDWTADQFLAALSRKCLLPPPAWRDPHAQLSVFEAQVFSRPGLRVRS